MQLMVSYKPLTEKYFEDFGLIRHPTIFQKYISCVEQLASPDFVFDLDVGYELKQQQRLGNPIPQPVQPAQPILPNIGSIFSSLLGPQAPKNDDNEPQHSPPKSQPQSILKSGLFGLKNVFNI